MNLIILQRRWHDSSVLRYVIVGAWNAFFSISLLYTLFFVFSTQHYEIELGITFLVSSGQSFLSQRKFVWKSSGLVREELVRFLAGTGSQYILSSVSLYVLQHGFHLSPSFVALPLMLTITSCFYFVNKHLVFK